MHVCKKYLGSAFLLIFHPLSLSLIPLLSLPYPHPHPHPLTHTTTPREFRKNKSLTKERREGVVSSS
jgi:hypothetical protein